MNVLIKRDGDHNFIQFGFKDSDPFTPEMVNAIDDLYDQMYVRKLACVPNPYFVCTKQDGFCYFGAEEIAYYGSHDVCPCEHDCPYALSAPICGAPSDAHCEFFPDVPIRDNPNQCVGCIWLYDEHDIKDDD